MGSKRASSFETEIVYGVCDQAGIKPTSVATKTSYEHKSLFGYLTTNAFIRLRGYDILTRLTERCTCVYATLWTISTLVRILHFLLTESLSGGNRVFCNNLFTK